MNITLNLTIAPGMTGEELRALLDIVREYETQGAPPRATGGDIGRERGPIELAYLEAVKGKRMRRPDHLKHLDYETAAQVLLAQFNAGGGAGGGAPPAEMEAMGAEYETPDAGDGDAWGE